MSKSFSYSFDPNESDRDWIRWRLGDTDCDTVLLYDEEYDGALLVTANRSEAALASLDSILAKLSRKVDSKMGKLELKLSQQVEWLRATRKDLEADVRRASFAAPRMVAHKSSLKQVQASDGDRVKPEFRRGMNEQDGVSVDGAPGGL